MKKKDEYNFKIEEYSELDLCQDSMNKEQKEKIKNKTIKIIEEIKYLNSQFKIDVTLEEILSLKNKLGEKSNTSEHGIENSNLLKYIILKTIEKDMENLKSEIIDELFVPSFISLPGVNTSYINYNAAYFFKMYLTKDKLIYYGISERFKIVSKKTIYINDIKLIGKSIKNKRYSKGLAYGVDTRSGYMSFIETKDKKIIYLNHLKCKYRKNVERFINSLEEVSGLKSVTKSPLTTEDKFVLGFEVIVFILFIILVVPKLIQLCMGI